MDIKNKTTTELKVMQEKIAFELSGRTEENQIPVMRMLGDGDFEYFDHETITDNAEYIGKVMKRCIEDKRTIFNIKMILMPESDYKDKKEHGEIQ